MEFSLQHYILIFIIALILVPFTACALSAKFCAIHLSLMR